MPNEKVFAQKHTDTQNFEWLVKRCAQMMKERGNQLPINLYHQLQMEPESEQSLQVLKAFSGSNPIAGIFVASNGSAATNLLGWNGEEGRRLKANHFLLWNAMLLLKEQGIRWFDLGGFDIDNTPGISEFKLRVNGEMYTLLGEGWSY